MENRKLRMGMIGGGSDAFIGAIHRRAALMENEIELVCGCFTLFKNLDLPFAHQLGKAFLKFVKGDFGLGIEMLPQRGLVTMKEIHQLLLLGAGLFVQWADVPVI